MMKRRILIIVLVIGGIVGYVHYNLEHYFFTMWQLMISIMGRSNM